MAGATWRRAARCGTCSAAANEMYLHQMTALGALSMDAAIFGAVILVYIRVLRTDGLRYRPCQQLKDVRSGNKVDEWRAKAPLCHLFSFSLSVLCADSHCKLHAMGSCAR